MSVLSKLRIGVASALVFAMPVQALTAATRPSAAVPTAATAVVAQDRDDGDSRGGGWALPAIGVIVAAIVLAIVLERHNSRGRGTGFSR